VSFHGLDIDGGSGERKGGGSAAVDMPSASGGVVDDYIDDVAREVMPFVVQN
jgi:hypothetical protein